MYAELHAKTNFSFLEGASHPDELVRRAAELGYRALAVTDRNSLAGVVRAHAAAKDAGLKLLVGAEITPDDAPPVVLWATDRAAYGRLARLITQGRRRAEKGDCRLSFDDIAQHAEGLLAGISGEWRVESGEETTGRRGAAKLCVPTQIIRSDSRLPTLHCPLLLPRPVRRSLLSSGRIAPRAGRRRKSRGCEKSPGRRTSRWWRPATCTTTCRSERRSATC